MTHTGLRDSVWGWEHYDCLSLNLSFVFTAEGPNTSRSMAMFERKKGESGDKRWQRTSRRLAARLLKPAEVGVKWKSRLQMVRERVGRFSWGEPILCFDFSFQDHGKCNSMTSSNCSGRDG